MTKMLEVKNLVKEYGELRAVDNVSFEINPGEIYGLLGPNGAGKTSLISCVMGLEIPQSGEIKLFGEEKSKRSTKSRVGLVPQEIINHGYFNVQEIVEFYSGYYGYRNNSARIESLLKKLKLFEKRKTKVKQLSGGMKRRLLIAKALSHYPDLVLLDEPTAGVDVELRETLWEFVRELTSEGKSVLLTTHYLQEAEALCDRIGILNHGKLLKSGNTKELIRSLTYKNVRLELNKDVNIEHKFLVQQTGKQVEFRISSEMSLGDMFKEVGIDPYQISDLQIKEGNLEDAFKSVVGAGS